MWKSSLHSLKYYVDKVWKTYIKYLIKYFQIDINSNVIHIILCEF
jgi:hypothetical protein